MEPLLVDTSVWIDFFRGRKTLLCQVLIDYIENDEPVLLCPVIVQEILQGIKEDSKYKEIRESILNFEILQIDHVEAAIGAADLYRKLRKLGTTIRKSNDCLIAFYSIYFKVTLLHNDSDFEKIASHTNLKTKK